MAVYTRHEVQSIGLAKWSGVMGSSYVPTAGAITILNSDGTQTKALGDFTVVGNMLLGGTIDSLLRTGTHGTIYESITGLGLSATAFVAAEADVKFAMVFAGSDTLNGHSGLDQLDGGAGDDVMSGGPGSDYYYANNPLDVVIEAPDAGVDSVFTALKDFTLPENVEYVIWSPQGLFPNKLIANGNDNRIFLQDEKLGTYTEIHGLGGDDTVILPGKLSHYSVGGEGDDLSVFSPPSPTKSPSLIDLRGVEHLQFADGILNPNDGNPLFDTAYYMRLNPDVWAAGVNALDHFNAQGWHEGRDPNIYFDTSVYLGVYKDVAAAGVNPLDHYQQSGWHEGRDPSEWFDTLIYLARNPDVAAAGVDPLEHYLQFGRDEGRLTYLAIGNNIVNGFDAQYYLMHNPDVAAAGVDPLQHFNQFGWHEGRNPSMHFNTAGYLKHYTDVADAGVNPLEHYMQFGWKEGRDPSAYFDTQGYLAANPDVAAAGVNPLEHYLQFGIYEGRQLGSDGMWG